MPGTLVRSIILSGADEKIRAAGADPAAVAAAAGIPAAALSDPDLLISGQSVIRFFDRASRTCRRPNWGLEMATGTSLAAVIGPLWVLLRNARTLRELCEDLARNYDLYSSVALMRFDPTRDGAILSWSPASGLAENEVQIVEFALATLLGEIRGHAPPEWHPADVWFRHAPPRDQRLHRRLFGPHLRFHGDQNAIHLDAGILGRPLRGGGPGNRALVRAILRHEQDMPVTATAPQVEGIVRSLLPFAPCAIADVARAMGLSVRTLQERLKLSGYGFRAIKDAVRRDLATKYLQHSAMTATQIAGVLGYNDPTSFSRSFRRWHAHGVRATRRGSADPVTGP